MLSSNQVPLASDNQQAANTEELEGRYATKLASLQRILSADEDTRPNVNGVISVKIKAAKKLHFHRFNSANVNVYASISIRNQCKRTRIINTMRDGSPMWNQTRHFTIIVQRDRKHPFNLLEICLRGFDASNASSYIEDHHRHIDIGTVSFHVHDIISASPISGTYDLWNENSLVGNIELEMTFSYGLFGYGYSSQLVEEHFSPEDLIKYSLFPRINPPKSQQEPAEGSFENTGRGGRAVLIPKAVPHPRFLPFKTRVKLSYGVELENFLERLEPHRFTAEKIAKSITRLSELGSQYFAMPDRLHRLTYLQGRLAATNMKSEVIQDDNQYTNQTFAPKGYIRFVQPPLAPLDSIMKDVYGTGGLALSDNISGPSGIEPDVHDDPIQLKLPGHFKTSSSIRQTATLVPNVEVSKPQEE